MPSPPRIVLVGKRRPALEAARRLGMETILWSEKPPGRSDRLLVDLHLELPPIERAVETAAEVAAELSVMAPVAVVAAAEGSVRAAAALREALGLPGTSRRTATLATDKLEMKRAVSAAGIRCARFAAASEGLDRDGLIERLGLPMVIKPRIGWGGRGARVARSAAEVPDGLADDTLAESFVEGVEMSVEALVAGGRRLFTNPTEYLDPGWSNVVPGQLSRAERRAVESLADQTLAALGVERGMIHLELYRTDDGPVFGEVAVRPPGGYILRLIGLAYDFDAWEAWLRVELGESPPAPETARRVAGVRLLYPGGGVVRRIEGVEAARDIPGVVEASVRVRLGRQLAPRVGVGQEAGRVIAVGHDRARVVAALEAARRAITLEVEPMAG